MSIVICGQNFLQDNDGSSDRIPLGLLQFKKGRERNGNLDFALPEKMFTGVLVNSKLVVKN